MANPSPWPLFTTQRPPNLSAMLDTTCFSTTDFDDFDDSQVVSQDHPMPLLSNPVNPANAFAIQSFQNVLDLRARYNHPIFPSPTFLTTLIQQERFKEYISNKFGSPDLRLREVSITTNQEPLHNIPYTVQIATTQWVRKAIFPDEALPVPFNDRSLNNIPECWDKLVQRFTNFPHALGEHAILDWLNHLSHTLGIQHGLVKPEDSDEVLSDYAGMDVETDKVGGVDEIDGGVDEECVRLQQGLAQDDA